MFPSIIITTVISSWYTPILALLHPSHFAFGGWLVVHGQSHRLVAGILFVADRYDSMEYCGWSI